METQTAKRHQLFNDSILSYQVCELVGEIYRFKAYKITYPFQGKRDLSFLIECDKTTEKLIVHYRVEGTEILHSVKVFRHYSFDKELSQYVFAHF